jgi:hypothetical protein
MTELLQKAFDQASSLPAEEQDRLAAWLLEELVDEQAWQKSFAGSPDALARLADEALAEYRAGGTQPLVPEKL